MNVNRLTANLRRLRHLPAPLRLLTFLLALLICWLPLALPIYKLVPDPNWVSILTMVILYAEFIILLRVWGRQVYQQPNILRYYGLSFSRPNQRAWLKGLAIGLSLLLSMFLLQGVLGWVVWRQPSLSFPRIALEGILVAVGIGFAEELLFRGWLLDELQRDYSLNQSLWINSLLFAALHFLKPLPEMLRALPQLLGLALLGLILVWAKRRQTQTAKQGLLGLPMGLHSGLVGGYYLLNVGSLVQYSDRVPDWITGINRNPLAGLVGVGFLAGLALWASRDQPKSYS